MTAAAVALLLVLAAEPQAPYLWPLDVPKAVTSSFGEYRGGRFHAGLDLRTGGVGREVRAPARGYVCRVRCSPWGYGKAVYLKLDDGNTAVFGHLSDFAPALREYVTEAQHTAKNYAVDLQPPEGMFRFNAGDAVAASGDTGIGPAHLHYELRDTQGRPFNPRLAGVTWPDTTAPLLHKIVLVPQSPGSTIDGDVAPRVLNCLPDGTGRFRCENVRAHGRIGVGIDLVDPANGGANKLGIHTLRTTAGGSEIFAIRLDTISYDESRHESVSYHPFLSDLGRFLLQWRWPGNACNVFANGHEGWLEVAEQPVEVKLEAQDFFGNTAAVSFTIAPEEETADLPAGPMDNAQPGRFDIECAGTWLVLTARFPGPEPDTPVLRIEGTGETAPFRRVGRRTFRAGAAPAPDAQLLAIAADHPRLDPAPRQIHVFHRDAPARTIALENAGATNSPAAANITVMPDSPYGVLFLCAEPPESGGETPAPRRGPILRLWPEQSPLDAPVELAVPIPPDARDGGRLAIYRRGKKGWDMIETVQQNGRLIAEISGFGEFAVLEDTEPPEIRGVSVQNGSVSARVSDAASGIASVDITGNGEWLLAAYDPEADRIELEPHEKLPPPPCQIVITATDNAGNTARSSKTLTPM